MEFNGFGNGAQKHKQQQKATTLTNNLASNRTIDGSNCSKGVRGR
jgi:hypothetical protein